MVKVYYTKKEKEFSHEFLFFLLEKHYGIKATESDLVKSPFGKLSLKQSKIFFNVSHSKDLIAIAFSDSEIGLDIEKIRNKNMSKLNYKYFGNKVSTREEFFTLWTMAESFVKYKAGSIAIDLKDIELIDGNVLFKGEKQNVVIKNIIFDDYVFAITKENDFEFEILNTTF